jgi:hypothetical protein
MTACKPSAKRILFTNNPIIALLAHLIKQKRDLAAVQTLEGTGRVTNRRKRGHPLKGPVNRKNHSIAKKFIFLAG